MAKSAAKKQTVVDQDPMAALMAASQVVEKTSTGTSDIKTVKVNDNVEVATAIDTFCKAKADEKEVKQRLASSQGKILPYALKHFLDRAVNGTTDRTTNFTSEVNTVQFSIQDVYKTKDMAKRMDALKAKYGVDIVTTTTEFSLDAELMKQKNAKGVAYGTMIAQFLMSNPDIPAEIRTKLLKATPTHVITQGTIDKLADIAKEKKVTVKEIVEDIGPTIQFKVRGEE